MSASIWIHPKTEETRVYIRGLGRGAKVFVHQRDVDEFGSDWWVTVQADWSMDKQVVRDQAFGYIESKLGRKVMFNEIVAAAKNNAL